MKRVAKRTSDRIPGGLAAGRRPSDFDRFALVKGTAVELEHTSDPRIAQEIAMDHLTEDPRYYEKLAKMETPSNPPHDYIFWTTCVASVGVLINEMQEQAQDVAYETMRAHCRDLLDVAEQINYERRSTSSHGLTLKNDWSVSYHKSKYCGAPCYYFVWSHIEHVWVRPEDQEKIVACEARARAAERGRTSILACSEDFQRGWEEGSRPEEEDEVEENPADVDIVGVDPEEDWELVDAAVNLAEHGPLHISRDREPRAVAVQEGNSPYPKVVGSLWDAVERNEDETVYTFDIDVDSKLDPARRHGVFKRLAQTAVDTFNELRDGPYPELVYRVYVVHPYARALLERLGFDVEDTIRRDETVGDAWFMTKYNPGGLSQRLLTPAEKRALFPGVRHDAEVFVGPEWDAALARLHRR